MHLVKAHGGSGFRAVATARAARFRMRCRFSRLRPFCPLGLLLLFGGDYHTRILTRRRETCFRIDMISRIIPKTLAWINTMDAPEATSMK